MSRLQNIISSSRLVSSVYGLAPMWQKIPIKNHIQRSFSLVCASLFPQQIVCFKKFLLMRNSIAMSVSFNQYIFRSVLFLKSKAFSRVYGGYQNRSKRAQCCDGCSFGRPLQNDYLSSNHSNHLSTSLPTNNVLIRCASICKALLKKKALY